MGTINESAYNDKKIICITSAFALIGCNPQDVAQLMEPEQEEWNIPDLSHKLGIALPSDTTVLYAVSTQRDVSHEREISWWGIHSKSPITIPSPLKANTYSPYLASNASTSEDI